MRRVKIYNFTGTHDCDTCGRVNCAHGIVLWVMYPIWFYCDKCIYELAMDHEIQEYEEALAKVQ